MSEDVLKLLAQAEELPVETDAPDAAADSAAVPYDPGLQQELSEHGPEALRLYGKITVRGTEQPERYNTAVWYALSQEPILRFENQIHQDGTGCVIITDPSSGKEPA